MASNASAQLHEIATRLKSVSDGKLIKRELTRDIRAAAQPLKSSLSAAAGRQLPHAGGLAARVARERITVSVLTGARTAGVRMKQSSHDAYTSNSGTVRHPVFGTSTWVEQEIPEAAGWWTDTAEREGPSVTPVILGVMRQIALRIQGR